MLKRLHQKPFGIQDLALLNLERDLSISAKIDLSFKVLECDFRLVIKNKGFVLFWLGKDIMKVKEVYMKGEGVNKWENGSTNNIGKEHL